MFGLGDKKNSKNDGAKILPEEKAETVKRRVIADIISRDQKIILTRKVNPPKDESEEYVPLKTIKDEPSPSEFEFDAKDAPIISGLPNGGKKRKNFNKPFVFSLLASVFIFGAAIFLVSTVFSNFILTITPKVEPTDLADVSILVDTKSSRPDSSQNIIPGELFEFTRSLSEEFDATGKENIETRARGTIKLYNSFSSSPQKLVATTRFLDESDKVFRLTKTIIVPGAIIKDGKINPSSIEVEAEANDPGEEFNIGPSRFKIPGLKGTPKYDTFYGESGGKFSGGFRGLATVVSADDVKKASESLTAKLFNSLRDDLDKKIPLGFHLIDPLREVSIENVSAPGKGKKAEKFKVEAKGKARAIVFRDKDLDELVGAVALINKQDKEIVDGSLSLLFKRPEAKFDKGIAQFNVSGSAKIKSKLNNSEILAFILGKKFGIIEEFLKKNDAVSSFQFKSFPFWNLNAPYDPKKVNILIK